MKNVYLLCFAFVALAISVQMVAQQQPEIISVEGNKITIKGVRIQFPADYSELTKLLGQPDRTIEKPVSVIAIWDKFGIIAYKSLENKINTINVNFRPGAYNFSPKQCFKGKIIINSVELSKESNKQVLQKVGFIVSPSDATWWDYESGATYLVAVTTKDNSELIEVEIGNNE